MTRQRFHIDRYDWEVVVFYNTNEDAWPMVRDTLEWCGCNEDGMRGAYDMVCGTNTGMTYSNTRQRKSVIAISETTSALEFMDTFDHEKCHLTVHICRTCGIDPYGEEMCYISGDLAKKMFEVCKEYLCDCCRRKTWRSI